MRYRRLKNVVAVALLTVGAAADGRAQGRDTAFAVHKLFVQRRHGSDALLATGAETVASTTVNGTVAGALGGLVAGALPAAVGFGTAARYSAERESAVLTNYANGWPLPPDVRRKLRPKHFRRTADDVRPGRR